MPGFKMEQCPHCEKKMPMHVLVKHLAKRHPTSELIKTSVQETVEDYKQTLVDLEKFDIEPRWDFQKTEKCATCGEEHPALLMVYHAHIRHGV